MRDFLLFVVMIAAVYAIPRLMEEEDVPVTADPLVAKAARELFAGETYRAGRKVSGPLATWVSRHMPRWREHATLRLDAAGLGAYTPGDLLASMVGYGLLFASALFVLGLIVMPPLAVACGLAGFAVGCMLRWQTVTEMGRKRQVACRLAGTRFAARLRSVLSVTGGPLPSALLRVCETDAASPLHDEVRKAVLLSQHMVNLSLDESLSAAAVRMGAPMLKRLFHDLCRGAEIGDGGLESCGRYVIAFYEELEFQVKNQSNKLAVTLLVSTVALGLPSALIQIMLLPVLQFMSSLRGLG